jgi:biopolymer transport protein TolR
MAGSNFGNGNGGPVANINVTPLVDVMLVMLVIFMITAPMLQQGVEVNLPKATTAPIEGKAEQIVVSVNKNGELFIGSGNKVDLGNFSTRIKAIMDARKDGDRKVYIKADTDLAYGRIMDVMSRLHEAGIYQIGLVSAPLTGGADEQTVAKKAK